MYGSKSVYRLVRCKCTFRSNLRCLISSNRARIKPGNCALSVSDWHSSKIVRPSIAFGGAQKNDCASWGARMIVKSVLRINVACVRLSLVGSWTLGARGSGCGRGLGTMVGGA